MATSPDRLALFAEIEKPRQVIGGVFCWEMALHPAPPICLSKPFIYGVAEDLLDKADRKFVEIYPAGDVIALPFFSLFKDDPTSATQQQQQFKDGDLALRSAV
jgi:hypothetical protein